MRILPVLDLQQGQVVRGIGGLRREYRPIVSKLAGSSEPVAVARAFRTRFGFEELYIADLDAIAGAEPDFHTLGRLQNDEFRLWVDAGIDGCSERTGRLAAAGIHTLIAGLETLEGPEALRGLVETFTSERVVFSLDMQGGRPILGRFVGQGWKSCEPEFIAVEALAQGVRRLLILDLANVGRKAGTTTLELCEKLKKGHAGLELCAGGGVRGWEDLRRMESAGVDVALVASALHDGAL